MNIYIPIKSFESVSRENLKTLSSHTVHFIYQEPKPYIKKGLPRVRPEFKTIKEQKNRIIKLISECGEEFAIMQDSDILHLGDGINLLIKEIQNSPEFSAVGLWPHYGQEIQNGPHVSTACMIFRTADVQNLQVEYDKGCFCSALIRYLTARGKRVKYLQQSNLIKEV